jgi:SAM-dependent methyltransferase
MAASTLSYSTVISPNDHMWATSPQYYYEIGLSAMACIERAITLAAVTPTAILDLPCGHGRVCRMLRGTFPAAHITVCDLDPDGVDFCASQFDADPVYGREDIRELVLPRTFDLIWCGSLLTHLNRDRWQDFLQFFASHLKPGGVIVMTTHGRRPVQWMLDGTFSYGLTPEEQHRLVSGYANDGFGFVSPSNQAFGISLSSLSYVCAQIEQLASLKLVGLQEAGWADHQDVVTCIRQPVPFVPSKQALDALSSRLIRPEVSVGKPLGNVDVPGADVVAARTLDVSGWAGDTAGIREVRIVLDGVIVAVVELSLERPDVSAVYPQFRHGHDRHGWRVEIPLHHAGRQMLSVEAVNEWGVAADIGSRLVTVTAVREG